MPEIAAAPLLLAAAGGVLIGLFYFGALWWTVRRVASAGHPVAIVAGSFLIRAAVAAAGIVIVSSGEPLPLVATVAGFLAGRSILIRAVGGPLHAEGVAAERAPVSAGRQPGRSDSS